MLKEFLFGAAADAKAPLAPSYYAAVHEELAAIEASQATEAYDEQAARQHQHVPAVDRPQRRVDIQSTLPKAVWGPLGAAKQRSLVRGRLKADAREVGQVLGLEVVRKLVEQVAQDPRLLAPVREAIVALEPSLLRLAMVAPRFFSEEEHPGRRLVERVAERSFRHNDEFSVDFLAFFGPVTQAFNGLNAIEAFEDAQPFRATLAALEANWAAQDTLEADAARPALGAVQFAEQRQEQAGRLAWELGQRSDLAGVPEPVQAFLFGPWSLVVAHARLKDPRTQVDPGGYVAVIADLLWSVKKELTLRDPKRAFVVIPSVLVTLRRGLGVLGQQPEESAAFFRQLEELHRPVMKLREKLRRQAGLEALPRMEMPSLPAVAAASVDVPAVWMAPDELNAVGFEAAAPAEATLLGRAAAVPARPLDAASVDQVIAGLVEECWVDLHCRQQWRRARLKWASERASLFMFVSDGGLPHSMTRRSLEKLVRDRLLRPVDADAVVPRALRTLTQPALRPMLAAA